MSQLISSRLFTLTLTSLILHIIDMFEGQTSPCDCANDSIPRHNSSPVPLSASAHLPLCCAQEKEGAAGEENLHMTRLLPLPLNPTKLSRLSRGANKGHRVTVQSCPAGSDEHRTTLQCARHSVSWDGIEIAGWASLSSATTSLRRSLSPRWDAGAPRRDSGSHVIRPRRQCGPCPPTLSCSSPRPVQ